MSDKIKINEILPDYPNFIIISGAGRNTGKTTFACSLIQKFSEKLDIYALKFSPHFHEFFEENNIIERNNNFIISEEITFTHKDSSLMLQSGAKKVYYIQTKQDHIQKAFNFIEPFIKDKPVICESGGLYEVLKPGIFFFLIKDEEIPENKKTALNYNPYILNSFKSNEYLIERIRYQNNKFFIGD